MLSTPLTFGDLAFSFNSALFLSIGFWILSEWSNIKVRFWFLLLSSLFIFTPQKVVPCALSLVISCQPCSACLVKRIIFILISKQRSWQTNQRSGRSSKRSHWSVNALKWQQTLNEKYNSFEESLTRHQLHRKSPVCL